MTQDELKVRVAAGKGEKASVPRVDAVLIGPNDRTYSLGSSEQYDHEKFERAVRTILAKARAKGAGTNIHTWLGFVREAEWASAGADLIVHGGDLFTFGLMICRDLRRLQKILDDFPGGTGAAA